MGPSRQDALDVPKGRVKSRLVVPAIVVDPAADGGIEHPRQIIERFVAALMKRPTANGLPNLFESLVACCWAERDTDAGVSARNSWPERIAKKVELLVTMSSTPVLIVSVDNLCFLRMKRNSSFSEPWLARCAHR